MGIFLYEGTTFPHDSLFTHSQRSLVQKISLLKKDKQMNSKMVSNFITSGQNMLQFLVLFLHGNFITVVATHEIMG